MDKKPTTYRDILLTGATGKLGKAILSLNLKDKTFLTPTRAELDITKPEDVKRYLEKNKVDAIIHCAAIARVSECDKNPEVAINTNILGTTNIAKSILHDEKIRLIYISTDYVYPGTSGQYKESDPTVPFTLYGWTKLGGECAVRATKNHCIIRTTFLDPNNIPFDTAPADAYRSTIPIKELAEAIIHLLDSEFKGAINVGQERKSMYEIWKQYKATTKPVNLPEGSALAKDSSLDVTLWKNLKHTFQ